jgi:hypothetical protein
MEWAGGLNFGLQAGSSELVTRILRGFRCPRDLRFERALGPKHVLNEQADLAAISRYLQFGSLILVTGSEELDGFFEI